MNNADISIPDIKDMQDLSEVLYQIHRKAAISDNNDVAGKGFDRTKGALLAVIRLAYPNLDEVRIYDYLLEDVWTVAKAANEVEKDIARQSAERAIIQYKEELKGALDTFYQNAGMPSNRVIDVMVEMSYELLREHRIGLHAQNALSAEGPQTDWFHTNQIKTEIVPALEEFGWNMDESLVTDESGNPFRSDEVREGDVQDIEAIAPSSDSADNNTQTGTEWAERTVRDTTGENWVTRTVRTNGQ